MINLETQIYLEVMILPDPRTVSGREINQGGGGELNKLYHIVSKNIYNNKLYDVVDNSMIFEINYSLPIPKRDTKLVLTFSLRTGKKQPATYAEILTFLWDIGAPDRIIKSKYMDTYQ